MNGADCTLEHVFDVEVLFGSDRHIFGPLPGGGHQGYTPAIGGTISGPRLTGRVVPPVERITGEPFGSGCVRTRLVR